MKAKMKPHKLLSMLLALVMVVGLLPMGQVAYAYSAGDIADTTGSGASEADPVVCDTFAGFKAAMENTEITYVKLTGAEGAMPKQESLAAAISNKTEKVLTIEGTNEFWSPLGGMNHCHRQERRRDRTDQQGRRQVHLQDACFQGLCGSHLHGR